MSPLETQMEISHRLYKMMLEDHEERVKNHHHLYEVIDSLMKKLKERDETIFLLRKNVNEIRNILNMTKEM